MQGLTAGLVATGVELPVEARQNDLRRQAGEGPGEHVPNEEVRLDRAPLDEQFRVVSVSSGPDGRGACRRIEELSALRAFATRESCGVVLVIRTTSCPKGRPCHGVKVKSSRRSTRIWTETKSPAVAGQY